jgi:putative FmdB family regulatory protein
MPTYEYVCESCGHEFEKFQTITARPIRKCPKCGKNSVQRLIGAGAGVIFKGSGFYQTDYRSESYKKSAESEKKTSDKDTTKKDTETKAKDSTTTEKSTSKKKDKKKKT